MITSVADLRTLLDAIAAHRRGRRAGRGVDSGAGAGAVERTGVSSSHQRGAGGQAEVHRVADLCPFLHSVAADSGRSAGGSIPAAAAVAAERATREPSRHSAGGARLAVQAGGRQRIALLGTTDEVVRAGGVLGNDLEHRVDVRVVSGTREVADGSRVGVDQAGIIVPASRRIDVQSRAGAIRARPEKASQLALVQDVEVVPSHTSRREGVVGRIAAGRELGSYVGRQVDGVDVVLGIATFLAADEQRVAVAANADAAGVDRAEPDRHHEGLIASSDCASREASAAHQLRNIEDVEGRSPAAAFASRAGQEGGRSRSASIVDARDLRYHRRGGKEIAGNRLAELDRAVETGSRAVKRHSRRVSTRRFHREGGHEVARVTAVRRGNGLSRPRHQQTHQENEECVNGFHERVLSELCRSALSRRSQSQQVVVLLVEFHHQLKVRCRHY